MKKIWCLIPSLIIPLLCFAQTTQFEKYKDGKGLRMDVYYSYTLLYLDVSGTMIKKIDYTKAYNENSPYYFTQRIEGIARFWELSLFSYGRLYRLHYKELEGEKFRTLSFHFHPTIKLSEIIGDYGTEEGYIGYGSINLPVSWNINSGTSARIDGRVVKGKRAINGFSYGIGLQLSILPLIMEPSGSDPYSTGNKFHIMPFINTERTRYSGSTLSLYGLQIGYFPQNYTERITTSENGNITVESNPLKNHAFVFRVYYGGYSKTRFTGGVKS